MVSRKRKASRSRRMGVERISTVAEFLTKIAKIRAGQIENENPNDLLFRGQPCDKPLLPKLGRLSPRGERGKIERLLLDKFVRECLPFLEFEPKRHLKNNCYQVVASIS